MAKQTREMSKYATSYKRRSASVDKRALRNLNRTLEQKEKRNETVNRRRTLYSTDESLKDIEEDETETKHEKVMEKKTPKQKSKAESRKEMLERWRKEKELKRKLEAQTHKKPGFKVCHVPDDSTITQKLAPVRPVIAASKVKSKPAAVKVTKSETKQVKPEPTKRVTRSAAAKAASFTTTVENAKVSGKSTAAPVSAKQRHTSGGGPKAGSSLGKERHSLHATEVKNISRVTKKAVTTRPSRSTTTASASRKVPEPSKGPTRSTRSTATVTSKSSVTKEHGFQRKRASTTTKPDKDEGPRKTKGKNVPTLAIDLDNTPHVTRSRGETPAETQVGLSFPSTNFQFKAPDNLTPFEFTPLSPGSAAGFLFPNSDVFNFSNSPSVRSKRCSTPKVRDLVNKAKIMHSPTASIIKEVDSTDSEAENEVKKRRSKTGSASGTPKLELQEVIEEPKKRDETESTNQNRRKSRSDKRSEEVTMNKSDTLFVTAMDELAEEAQMEVDEPKPPRRRSRRISSAANGSEANDNETKAKAATPKRHRSSRRSIADNTGGTSQPSVTSSRSNRRSSTTAEETANAEQDSSSLSGEITKSVASAKEKTPSRRRSTRRSAELPSGSPEESDVPSAAMTSVSVPSTETGPEKTPSRKRRRSTRKSLAIAGTPRLSDIPEPLTEVEHDGDTEEALSQKDANTSNKKKTVVIVEEHLVSSNIGSPIAAEERKSTPVTRQPSSSAVVFRTPASLPSNRKVLSARRKTTAGSVSSEFTHSASRQTPRSLNRCSLVLKTLSPEEGVEVLMKSPMIEMERKRKTPKTPKTPGFEGRIEPINFDELDESLNSTASTGTSSSQEPVAETLGPNLVETEIPVQTSTESKTRDSAVVDSGISCGEVVSTNEESITNDMEKGQKDTEAENVTSEGEHDVPYFRNLVSSTVSRLNQLSEEWEEISKANPQLSGELQDEIRMTTGQAQLLISKKGRFTQFANLVDDCEFQRGEQKTTCADLQGFWEMVNFQVEDVYAKFDKLRKLQENNWEEKKDDSKAQPKKKIVKKKTTANKPGASKPSAKSKFAEFRAKMKQQQQDKKQADERKNVDVPTAKEQTKTFEGGFFRINSPVKNANDSALKSVLPRLSRSSSKPSTPKRFSNSPSCASPLLLHVISRRSRSIGGGNLLSAENSLVINNANTTESPGSSTKTQHTANTPSQRLPGVTAASIFTPDSPAVRPVQEQNSGSSPKFGSARRSKRLSSKLIDTSAPNVQDSPGGLLKYLVPSSIANTDPESMEIDPKSPHDVEMSATMKRGLLSEFVKSGSKESTSSIGGSALRRSSVRVSASERRRSSLGRKRRSVHFNLSTADLENLHSTAPTTPFNRNSLVPRRRTHSGRNSSASEQKENLLFTPPSTSTTRLPVSESPATKMSKLTFDSNSPMSTIFTPPSGSTRSEAVTHEPPVGALIDLDFSPHESGLTNDGAGHPTEGSDRRISLL